MRWFQRRQGYRALGLKLALLGCLAFPSTNATRALGLCQTPMDFASLQVRATGLEDAEDWAIIKLGGSQSNELVVTEGQNIERCYQLLAVRRNSVVVLNKMTQERREFFMAGHSRVEPPPAPKDPVTNDDFVHVAMEKHSVIRESNTVDRIEYPQSSNAAHLPKLIYHNRAGSSFYGDYQALGLGERIPGELVADTSPHVEGVRVNQPSKESLLGSMGLKDGQKIVAINGHFVKTPQDVSRVLEARGDEPLSVSYYDPAERMILATHGIISAH